MNRTTILVGIVSGAACACGAYGVALSKDTTLRECATTNRWDQNSNSLNPYVRTSSLVPGSKYEAAISRCREHARIFKDEVGTPGLVVGVSVDGTLIWEEGMGYANLETRTLCNTNTAMRIGSISKPITMALLGKLHDEKKVNYDESVNDIVSYFPEKKFDGERVNITVRQLASHTAGVRHYKKKGDEKNKDGNSNPDQEKEFYHKERVDSIEKAVEMFKNDELLFKPGTSYEYTTHGYTLLSAVIEKIGGRPFAEQIESLFREMNLQNTQLDRVQRLVLGRASYYDRNKGGRIVNAELADLSYKWAGGGIISTVGDLCKFGNVMLYSYQQSASDKPGYLKSETVKEMWTKVEKTPSKWGTNSGYGLGWDVVEGTPEIGGVVENEKFSVGHSGASVGASSILLIVPKSAERSISDDDKIMMGSSPPRGVVVAVLVNLQNVSCRALAKKIAQEFYNV